MQDRNRVLKKFLYFVRIAICHLSCSAVSDVQTIAYYYLQSRRKLSMVI